MGDPSHVSLGLVGAAIAVLCCLAPLLLLSSGGILVSTLAGFLNYAWIALPVLLIGLTAWLLWRCSRPRNSHTERNYG